MLNNIVSHMSELTQSAFIDCIFKEGEDTTNCVRIEGISDVFDLHSQRLEKKMKPCGHSTCRTPSRV